MTLVFLVVVISVIRIAAIFITIITIIVIERRWTLAPVVVDGRVERRRAAGASQGQVAVGVNRRGRL
jgi:hypothetical protein